MINTKGFLFLLLVFASCHPVKKAGISAVSMDSATGVAPVDEIVYRASNTLKNDLIHMRLEIKFDWEKKHVHGKALLTFTPVFYPENMVYLNARGMDLHEIALLSGTKKEPLRFTYQNDSISIFLSQTYRRGDRFTLMINYTAKPDDLKQGGSQAITSDKGLYFINADGKDNNSPKQIWSQGETQSNSAWFPTIDSPNERMTQELFITVDTAYTTLSNGILVSSTGNSDGTKTDFWKQSLPAAPYLTMIAIGKYAVVKDKWRNMEVSYYVEPEYEPYARLIFGHTPEMLEFFSKKLNVDYPWEKYAQVVVRDYVSGAMENTTAVIHNEYIQQDSREHLDNNFEDVIAHELFHHWFGNLVTCESWSNVALNESFATYGQYLWNEYKYGRDEADYKIHQDFNDYISQGRASSKDLIRYYYDAHEDLFDVVSYEKGGRILHMLRKVVGDDAFFAALKLYLETNKFKAVEVHHLRLAFEEVTGQDLNWFFNEWFFSPGHPEIRISYHYDDSLHRQYVFTEQNQDQGSAPVYQMPVAIDFYNNNDTSIRKEIVLKNPRDTFVFFFPEKPRLVNFDAEKMLLAVKNDQHDLNEWIYMFDHAPLYADRYESLNKLVRNYEIKDQQAVRLKAALQDKHWNIRAIAVKNIGPLAGSGTYRDEIKTVLENLAVRDRQSAVRSAALKALDKYYQKEMPDELFKNAAGDSSYTVMADGIRIYVGRNKREGLLWLKQFESTDNRHISGVIAGIYSEEGSDENNSYFVKALTGANGISKYQMVSEYARFLSRCTPATISQGILLIEDVARSADAWWVRMSGVQALTEILNFCNEKSAGLADDMKEATHSGKAAIEIQALEIEKKRFDNLIESVNLKLADIKKNETDANLKKIYSGSGD